MKALVGNPKYWRTCASLWGCGAMMQADAGQDMVVPSNIDKARAAEGSRLRQHARADAACHRRGLAVAAAGGHGPGAAQGRLQRHAGGHGLAGAWPRGARPGRCRRRRLVLNTNMHRRPGRSGTHAHGRSRWRQGLVAGPTFPRSRRCAPYAKLGPAEQKRIAAELQRGHRRRPVRAVGEPRRCGRIPASSPDCRWRRPGVLGVDKTPERRAAGIADASSRRPARRPFPPGSMRWLLAMIKHETNTFSPVPTRWNASSAAAPGPSRATRGGWRRHQQRPGRLPGRGARDRRGRHHSGGRGRRAPPRPRPIGRCASPCWTSWRAAATTRCCWTCTEPW